MEEAVPVAITVAYRPGSSSRPTGEDGILCETRSNQARVCRPPTTTTAFVVSPTVATPKRKAKKRKLNNLKDEQSFNILNDSASESNESSEGEAEEEYSPSLMTNMRLAAEKIRSLNIYEEESQAEENVAIEHRSIESLEMEPDHCANVDNFPPVFEVYIEENQAEENVPNEHRSIKELEMEQDHSTYVDNFPLVVEVHVEENQTEEKVAIKHNSMKALKMEADQSANVPTEGGGSSRARCGFADNGTADVELPAEGDDDSVDPASPPPEPKFIWSEDFSTFTGVQEQFSRIPGPQVDHTEAIDLFLHVWDRSIVEHIAFHVNLYALQFIDAQVEAGIPLGQRIEAWKETDVDEIYRLFAILNYMSLDFRARIDEYWSTGVLGMPEFRRLMSKSRFMILMRFLHFTDNTNSCFNLSKYERKISKIKPIINHCNKKFAEMYIPRRYLSLDESLLLWKGRLSWVQCVRSKAARFGMKSFELCESESGYLLGYILYAGKSSSLVEGAIDGFENATSKVVLELIKDYLDKGHCLVMDNWYNQLSMTRYLKMHGTDVIGTMDRRRKHVPSAIKNAKQSDMERGDMIAQHCGDIAMVTWNDVKLVTTISTYHKYDTRVCRRANVQIEKPDIVVDYNKYMGGVDLKDQKLSMFMFERKRGNKFYLKVFRRMMNTSLLNTFIIYTANQRKHNPGALAWPLSHRNYRYLVSEELLKRFKPLYLQRSWSSQTTPETRLDRQADHHPGHTPFVSGTEGRRKQLRCKRCWKRGVRKTVTTMCLKCDTTLCLGDCWVEYHTLENLSK